jgi:pyruvate/2-oxoglutarate dehydrogenase complex dihydrolipoamide acyltransferase (E2) component
MHNTTTSYQIIEMPRERRGMAAYLDLKTDRNVMYALLEVDVTDVRRFIDEVKTRTKEQLSFTGYLIYCLARAVESDKSVQSYRKGKRKLVLYDNVDVGFMIELKRGEGKVLRGHVIHDASRKTFRQIHDEIRLVQSSQVQTDSDKASWFLTAMQLPWPFSKIFQIFFKWVVSNNPNIVTSMAGTVGISSVGMFGKGHSGWGISDGTHALDLVVGGTAQKLSEIDGKIQLRDMMSLTIIFDHDVIDGAPATRFTRHLVELIEGAQGIDESQPVVVQEAERV